MLISNTELDEQHALVAAIEPQQDLVKFLVPYLPEGALMSLRDDSLIPKV